MWSHLKDKGIKLPEITWREINKQVDPVLREMEKTGILLDTKILNESSKKYESRLKTLEKEIHALAKENFNINSPIQMADVLFNKLKLPTTDLKKTKTGFSTAAGELKKLESKHKIIKPILEHRELSKLISTYLKPLPLLVDKSSRLHTTYGQDTSTGRITSSEPNLQNIPIKGERGAEIRKAFIASPGMVLVAADYSQIELRVVACLAEDAVMIEAFRSKEDIHSHTASEIFGVDIDKVTADQRRVAKTVNFGVLYGMSPYGLSQALGIEQGEAVEYIKKYFEKHKGIKEYCNRMIELAEKEGYVETLFGFKREFLHIHSPYRNVAEAEERMAINAPVQGTAAEILKLAMVELDKQLSVVSCPLSVKPQMLLTIHDEIVLEVPKKDVKKIAKLVKESMENVVKICVPIEAEVETGKNLGELIKILI
jgi:DNA polymerase I